MVGDGAPRSRFSLYEGPRDPPVASSAKTRYSVCVEPRELHSDLGPPRRRLPPGAPNARHSICTEGRELQSSRISLSMEPRNPLLDLLESVETAQIQARKGSNHSTPTRTSPTKSTKSPSPRTQKDIPPPTRDAVETSPSPPSSRHRPRAHSTSITQDHSALAPRSRTNLALFRHSALFN